MKRAPGRSNASITADPPLRNASWSPRSIDGHGVREQGPQRAEDVPVEQLRRRDQVGVVARRHGQSGILRRRHPADRHLVVVAGAVVAERHQPDRRRRVERRRAERAGGAADATHRCRPAVAGARLQPAEDAAAGGREGAVRSRRHELDAGGALRPPLQRRPLLVGVHEVRAAREHLAARPEQVRLPVPDHRRHRHDAQRREHRDPDQGPAQPALRHRAGTVPACLGPPRAARPPARRRMLRFELPPRARGER